MDGLSDVVIEGAVLVTGVRVFVASRAPALARPRRGSADLGDRDATPRRDREAAAGLHTASVEPEPWIVGAAWTALAVTVGFAVRGAVALV